MCDLCVDMCDVCVTSPVPARGASLHLGYERNLGSFVLMIIASANVFANAFANVVANAFANAFAKVVTNAFCSEGGERSYCSFVMSLSVDCPAHTQWLKRRA